jgi:rhamnosyl/mannosyltransferase
VREKFGSRLVIAVGRLVYYKGFDYLIEAMSGVDGRLLIIGEGPLRVELERLAVDRGLRDKVVFLGRVTDAAPYYHACDVFVLPSVARSEAFGIVQLEAMAAGRPVINTQLDSGVPFVSLNGVSGLTVPPAHARSLTFGINLLLDDPILRSRYGAAAQARVQNLFSLEAMASRTLQIYREVLETRKPAIAEPGASRRARPRATGGVASL